MVYFFEIGDRSEMWLASADWMTRNLLRRIETAWPVEDRRLRERIYEESLAVYLQDNSQAWELQPDGSYLRCSPGEGEPVVRAQDALVERATRNG